MAFSSGNVYLIGAGPGDPGLLTLKGKACIEAADVVVYDYLAAPALLSLARKDAECIYVGKKGGDHTLSQDGINQLLVKKAQEGNVVARLKGGDPFIFGRGGEEAEVLIAAGIPYEVVPGVTAAIAATAYAGIPLTHRKLTSTLAFVTGHEDPTKNDSRIDWQSLAKGIGTIVFYMGVRNLPNIVKRLMEFGRSPETPVGLIRWGTTTKQQTVTGTLATIEEEVKKAGLSSPAIIVVGEVVEMRGIMAWFEKSRPLLGKRVIVTRAREQASGLLQELTDLGAECIEMPTIRITEPEDFSGLDAAIDHLDDFDWLVFTSVNGVKHFFARLFAKGLDVRALHQVKTACIGPVTAQRLREFGIVTDILPESYRAESVVTAFADVSMKEKRVLLPRAAEARTILPDALREMGAIVEEAIAYVTVPVEEQSAALIRLLETGGADLVTFTSSSTVKNFHRLIPQERFAELTNHLKVASIGPITSDTAKELGFTVDAEAETYTIPGLLAAIRTV